MKRKTFWYAVVSILVVTILLSTATAIPISSKEAVKNAISIRNAKLQISNEELIDNLNEELEKRINKFPEQDRQELREFTTKVLSNLQITLDKLKNTNPQNLKDLSEILRGMSIIDILKGRYASVMHKGITSFNGDVVIDQCWTTYNEDSVRDAIADAQTIIGNKINQAPEQDRELLKEYYDIDNAFSLVEIAKRISTLQPGKVVYNVQDLMKIPDNYNDFNQSYQKSFQTYMKIVFNHENETKEDWQDVSELYYPFVDEICYILYTISLLWAIPMFILLGIFGLLVSSFITYIFFCPITVPCSLWIGSMEMLKTASPDLIQEIHDLFLLLGIIGVIVFGPWDLIYCLFNEGCMVVGFQYVFAKLNAWILLFDVEKGWTLTTCETAPEFWEIVTGVDAITGWVTFRLVVADQDIISSNYPVYQEQRRDYIQVGFDWNGDGNPDEWTKLYEQWGGSGDEVYIEYSHRFSKGSHSVNIWVRDNWGVSTGPIVESFKIGKSKTQDVPKLLTFVNSQLNAWPEIVEKICPGWDNGGQVTVLKPATISVDVKDDDEIINFDIDWGDGFDLIYAFRHVGWNSFSHRYLQPSISYEIKVTAWDGEYYSNTAVCYVTVLPLSKNEVHTLNINSD